MMGLRMPELLVILVVVTLLFGGKKLPQLGAGLGQGIRSFKRAMNGEDEAAPAQAAPAQAAAAKPSTSEAQG